MPRRKASSHSPGPLLLLPLSTDTFLEMVSEPSSDNSVPSGSSCLPSLFSAEHDTLTLVPIPILFCLADRLWVDRAGGSGSSAVEEMVEKGACRAREDASITARGGGCPLWLILLGCIKRWSGFQLPSVVSNARRGGRWGVSQLINKTKRKLAAALKLHNSFDPFSDRP